VRYFVEIPVYGQEQFLVQLRVKTDFSLCHAEHGVMGSLFDMGLLLERFANPLCSGFNWDVADELKWTVETPRKEP